MIKITDISGPKPIAAPDTSVKSKESDLFRKTLDNALQVKSESTADVRKNTLGEIQAPLPSMVEGHTGGLNERTGRLLSRLDVLAGELNNPERSLKDIEPVIQSIKDEADQISETMKKEEVTDGKLKNIIMESIMTANIEYHKFYRGDYL